MPIFSCVVEGNKGYKWGSEGKCYKYNPKKKESIARARNRARKQGIAAIISGFEFIVITEAKDKTV